MLRSRLDNELYSDKADNNGFNQFPFESNDPKAPSYGGKFAPHYRKRGEKHFH
jgi:hypothetical protein